MSETTAPPADPGALIRSKSYRVLLVFAALIGVLVSFASWCFLELVHWIQQEVYKSLPSGLGLHPVPWWWPLPVLAVAGLLAAVAIVRLPGRGGHIPYEGIKAGTAKPAELPGILLAALATLGLGLVLGPEAPLIALGAGLAIVAVRRVKKDTPDQVMAVLAASAAFAAIATIFGSPVIGAIILIEAAGLGGPMLPLVLLPGLMSAGIGSVVFIGMGHWTGLSSSAYALSPFSLPAFSNLTVAQFGWAIALAFTVALITVVIIKGARASAHIVAKQPWLLLPAAALTVGGLAIAFGQITHQPADTVLFSGQDAFASLIKQGPTLALSTLAFLLLFKGLAWIISLGSFRGGPTFPALFLGAAGGLLAGHLPGFSETPAVAVLMAAGAVSILRLPLSATVITLLLTSKAGIATAPLIIVAVVVAYLTIQTLSPARGPAEAGTPTAEPQPAAPRPRATPQTEATARHDDRTPHRAPSVTLGGDPTDESPGKDTHGHPGRLRGRPRRRSAAGAGPRPPARRPRAVTHNWCSSRMSAPAESWGMSSSTSNSSALHEHWLRAPGERQVPARVGPRRNRPKSDHGPPRAPASMSAATLKFSEGQIARKLT